MNKTRQKGSILIAALVFLLMLSSQLLAIKIVLILAEKQALSRYEMLKSYDTAYSGLSLGTELRNQLTPLSSEPSKTWLYANLNQGRSIALSDDEKIYLFKSATAIYSAGITTTGGRCLLKGTLAPTGNPTLYIKVEKL